MKPHVRASVATRLSNHVNFSTFLYIPSSQLKTILTETTGTTVICCVRDVKRFGFRLRRFSFNLQGLKRRSDRHVWCASVTQSTQYQKAFGFNKWKNSRPPTSIEEHIRNKWIPRMTHNHISHVPLQQTHTQWQKTRAQPPIHQTVWRTSGILNTHVHLRFQQIQSWIY